MQIDQIPLDRLSVSKANMRQGKKPPDVSDILPSIVRRGVIIPLLVRPNCNPGHYEIMAGKRRFFASEIAAKECEDRAMLPCIVLGEGDDAEALEVSMIENLLRQNPDQVTQWESYTRLVKEGRSVEDIAATFALTEVQVKRILALGNLLPRIAAGIALNQLNFGYSFSGDRPDWRPVRAFDDGVRVYIEFPESIAQGEMPPLFVIGPGGVAELVNYRVSGRYMIVDRLFAEAELRMGDRKNAQRVRIRASRRRAMS